MRIQLKEHLKRHDIEGDEMQVSSHNLKNYCAEVPEGESVLGLVAGMLRICEEKEGVGLAANQVGVMKRVVVFNFSGFTQALINPTITRAWGGMTCLEEGCLSFPLSHVRVFRHKKITIRGFDVLWNPIEYRWRGHLARIAQHELDHLDGITMFDRRVTPAKLRNVANA
jgi:peptide deformylase